MFKNDIRRSEYLRKLLSKYWMILCKITERMRNENCFMLIVSIFFFFYLFCAYKALLKDWYDEYIMPIFSLVQSNIFSDILFFCLIGYALYDLYIKYRNRFRFGKTFVFLLFVCVFLLSYYRLSSSYTYLSWIGCITYVDVIAVAGLLYLLLFIYNTFVPQAKKRVENEGFLFLHDGPICKVGDDILDLKDDAKQLADNIRSLDKSTSWSLAISSPWGGGKTSFLNLIIEELENYDTSHNIKSFEIVNFNPRRCHSQSSIQEEFFTLLSSTLSRYDGSFNDTLKKYMASLQLIDDRILFEKLVSFYKIWNQKDLKESLSDTFQSLDFSILVLIDDFDRLSKEEVLEVLKLIDGNASFPNLVFLTAFDKENVNKALGMDATSCFIDKFFNMEFAIPKRPFGYYSKFLEESLFRAMSASKSDQKVIAQIIKNNKSAFQQYLPTLRDMKRYINQVHLDYSFVRGDVLVNDFLIIEIIKLKLPFLYDLIYTKKILRRGSFKEGTYIWFLNDDLGDEVSPFKNLLYLLFIKNIGDFVDSYRHIYNAHAFDNYFCNKIYNILRINEIEILFTNDFEKVKAKINEWIQDDDKQSDLVFYLDRHQRYYIHSLSSLKQFAHIIAYLASRIPNGKTYFLFLSVIRYDRINKYFSDEHEWEDYKQSILSIIKNKESDHCYELVATIHKEFKVHDLKEEDVLVKDADVWPWLKQGFLETVQSEGVNEYTTSWLYACVDHREEPSLKIVLDSDCTAAFRYQVEKNPSFYLEHFVRLGGISSSEDYNSIACEPFWRQIWGNESMFEDFINRCLEKSIQSSSVVANFWKLYKANNFNAIEFDRQGNVQDKIKKGLNAEVNMLEAIQSIQNDIEQISDETESLSIAEKETIKQILASKNQELNNIPLDINLKGCLIETIMNKLKQFG